MLNKIEQVVALKKFKPVINIQDVNANEKDELMNGYIVTEELAEHFERILENITLAKAPHRRDSEGDINPSDVMRSFILRGSYGTGKSYFLLIISSILESIANGNIDIIRDKFKEFDNITYHLDQFKKRNDKYLVIDINGVFETDREFEDVIRKNFIDKCKTFFDDYLTNSVYENAINELIEDKNSPRWALIKTELDKMDLDIDQLLSGLRKYKREYLGKYISLVEAAYRRKIDIYSGDFKEFIEEATSFVKSKGYKGIAFVFDEFSAYLTACVEDGKINKSLASVQRLAEETELSRGKDLIFITSMHRTFAQVIHGVMVNEDDVEKVKGRFKELQIAFNKGEKLIENTLRIDVSKYQEVKVQHREVISYVEKITNNEIQKFYPIHTSTLQYLKLLSQRYAQENRTIFRFLAEEVGRKCKEDIIVDGSLNLVTPDYVYDYFIGSISEDNDTLMLSINSVLAECSENWHKQVIKLLVVSRLKAYDIKQENIKIGLSVKEICDSLLLRNEEPVRAFLNGMLNKPSVNIYHNDEKDLYEFFESGSSKLNIYKMIDDKAKEVDEYQLVLDLLQRMNGDISKEFLQRGRKGITPVERSFSGTFNTLSSIKDKLQLGSKLLESGDGTINFIIPKFFEKNDLDANYFKTRIINYPNNVAIAVPKTYELDVVALRKYGAMIKLQDSKEIRDDERTKEYLDKEITRNRRQIEESVKKFASIINFKFVFNKEEVMEFKQKDDLFAFILRRHYSKFPQIDTENINKRLTTNKIIDNFVVPKERILPAKIAKEEDRQIKETMKSLDLAEVSPRAGGEERAVLKLPVKRNNEKSWEIFEKIIEKDKELNEKLQLLQEAPYGLPDYLIELYISCAVSLGKVYLMEGEVLKDNTSANINKIQSGKYQLIPIEIGVNLEELAFTKMLWSIVAQHINSLNAKTFSPEKGINFNTLRIGLGKDIDQFKNSISTGLNSIKVQNLKIGDIETLYSELDAVSKIANPKNFIEKFNNIPMEIFNESDRNKALTKFDQLIFNYKDLINNLLKVQSTLAFSSNRIEQEHNRFNGIETIEKVYNDICQMRKEYENNPFLLDKIDSLDALNKDLIMTFNIEFRKRHQALNDIVYKGKQQLNSNEENELIDLFEKFNFRSIRLLNSINSELNKNFHSCFNKFEQLPYNELIECSCVGGKVHLNIFDKKAKEFEEEKINSQRTIIGLVSTYLDKFAELRNGINGKEPIKDYISRVEPTLVDVYTTFMINLNNDPVAEKRAVIENGELIVDIVNKYIKYTQEVVTPQKPRIALDEVNQSIMNQLKWTGKSEITVEEYLRKVREIVAKQVGDKIISIN